MLADGQVVTRRDIFNGRVARYMGLTSELQNVFDRMRETASRLPEDARDALLGQIVAAETLHKALANEFGDRVVSVAANSRDLQQGFSAKADSSPSRQPEQR